MTKGKLFIAGEWIETTESAAVRDKYTGEEIGRVGIADRSLTERAVAAARSGHGWNLSGSDFQATPVRWPAGPRWSP